MFAWLKSNVPAVSFRVPRSRKTFTRLEVLSSLSTNAAAPLLPASCLEQGGSGLEFSAKVWQATIFGANTCLSVDVNWI